MGRDSTYEERLNNFRELCKRYNEEIQNKKRKFKEQGLLVGDVLLNMARYYAMLIALDAVTLGIKHEDVDKVLRETIPEGILSGDDL